MWFGGLGLLVVIYFAAKDVPEYLHFLLALIALWTIGGELFARLFYTSQMYDKGLHLIDSFVICLFAAHLTKNKIKPSKTVVNPDVGDGDGLTLPDGVVEGLSDGDKLVVVEGEGDSPVVGEGEGEGEGETLRLGEGEGDTDKLGEWALSRPSSINAC